MRFRAGILDSSICLAAVVLLATSAAAQMANAPATLQLSASPWSKTCSANGACATSSDGTADGKFALAVSVIDRADGQSRIRIVWKLGMRLSYGTRLIVDSNTPVVAPFVACHDFGCTAEITDRGINEQLARGVRLFVQAQDGMASKLLTAELPLRDFGKARNEGAAGGLDSRQPAHIADALSEPKAGNEPPFGPGERFAHTPWMRHCAFGQACFTFADARTAAGQLVLASSVFEFVAAGKKLDRALRLTVPLGTDIGRGLSYRIDHGNLTTVPYDYCGNDGCSAHVTGTPDLIAALRRGVILNVVSMSVEKRIRDIDMPLMTFARSYDGAPVTLAAREALEQKWKAQRLAGQLSPPQPRRDSADLSPRLAATPAPVQTATATPALAAPSPAMSPISERRLALVIGNSAYTRLQRLPNPKNDAADFAAELRGLNFDVILGTDLTRSAMENILAEFARRARNADTALVYYAGHGLQYNGINYLAPVDATLTDETDLRRMINMQDVLSDLQSASRVRILMVDACRDNEAIQQLASHLPKARSASLSRGLAKAEADGTIVAFATQPNRVAADGDDRNSPFTQALLKRVKEPGVDVRVMLTRVRSDVVASTKGMQRPEVWDSLIGEFSFR